MPMVPDKYQRQTNPIATITVNAKPSQTNQSNCRHRRRLLWCSCCVNPSIQPTRDASCRVAFMSNPPRRAPTCPQHLRLLVPEHQWKWPSCQPKRLNRLMTLSSPAPHEGGAHTRRAQSLLPNKSPIQRIKDAWPQEQYHVESTRNRRWGTPD